MARNKVQFQKGLSEAGFEAIYGTKEKMPRRGECVAVAGRLPVLHRAAYCQVKSRGLFQCSACRRQSSPIAGTI
jgi:hypothetical protein